MATFCWENGLDFATEVTFNNRRRADFVVKDWALVIEVLDSESVTKFKEKIKDYPLPVIGIKSIIDIKSLKVMLDELLNTNGSCWSYYENKYLGGLN